MGTYKVQYRREQTPEGNSHYFIERESFDGFIPDILGIGNPGKENGRSYVDALAVIFDLEGFTKFCNQSGANLVVPDFVRCFLEWVFKEVRDNLRVQQRYSEEGEVTLFVPLPFFAKYLGDGVLYLWDLEGCGASDVGGIIKAILNICDDYEEFVFLHELDWVDFPRKLRCGIARGFVTPLNIGGDQDFVGQCINMASRLQKIGKLSFAFSRDGINLRGAFDEDEQDWFMVVGCPIRGVHENALICVLRDQFDDLSEEDKKEFDWCW